MAHIFRKKLDRRTLLKGMLGASAVTISLPLLDMFLNDNGNALADGGALPRRFGWWFWGNGVVPDRWVPLSEGEDYMLNSEMAAFGDELKRHITVVSGTAVVGDGKQAHLDGPSALFSGHVLREGAQYTFDGPTIDVILKRDAGVRGQAPFASIETASAPPPPPVSAPETYSQNGPGDINPPIREPRLLYERLFGGGTQPGSGEGPDPSVQLRRSALSAVMEDIERVKGRLGSNDRARLEQHLDNVREIELRLLRIEENPVELAACEQPDRPGAFPIVDGRVPIVERHRAHADLMTMALACDQARVFSHMFSGSVDGVRYLDMARGHHLITHDGSASAKDQVDEIVTLIMGEFAYFCESLRAIPEGDGSLLDNTLLLGTTDCDDGELHTFNNYPLMIAGSGCGRIRTGLHVNARGESSGRVVLSLLRAMGLNMASWGYGRAEVTDGLGAIEAG